MNFKDLVNQINRSIIVCGPSLKIKYLNEFAKKELKINNNSFEEIRIFDVLTFSQENKEKLTEAMINVHPIILDAFIEADSKTKELVEKKVTCKYFGYSDDGIRLFLFEIAETVISTLSIQHVHSLGNVTGDLAHALSNPLAVIQINCDSLDIQCQKETTLKSKTVKEKVGKIGTALDRVNNETAKLKDISRKLSDCDEVSLKVLLPGIEDAQGH